MSQQIPPCLFSAKGPFPQAKRRWTFNAKLQTAVFTPSSPQAQGSSGSWRSWMHTKTTPEPAPFPSPVCYGSFRTLPRWLLLPPCTLVHQLAGRAETQQHQQPKATAATETHPAAASACHGEMGYGSKCLAWGLDHRPTDSSGMSLWHPQQPTPRRNHLSAIF